MSCSWCLRYILFVTLSSHIVRTVPPDYCLAPLNRSDCNMAPKTVYSYYKPGSRCERETWRGCPTANKFDNEYLCSLNCIFRMRQDDPVDFDPCNIPLNQSICGEETIVVTHENGYCKQAWWGGCPSYNMFDDVHKCVVACNGIPQIEVPSDKLVTTPRTPITETVSLEKIDEILDDVIKNELRTTTEQETETESTTETDSVTESITTEEITTDEITTEDITTKDVTTEDITTEDITTEETTTEAPGEISTNDDFDEVLTP